MEKILEDAYEHARLTLSLCSTKHGFFASGGKEGYNAVWARDSIISSSGASLLPDFKEIFKASLETLGNHQSKNGQIPNAVDKYSDRKPHVDFQSIDSSLWYIIGHHIYIKRYEDSSLFRKFKKSIKQSFQWLRCQDLSEVGMLAQLPTTDWQDAFPHKYGHTINTQALYYEVLNLLGKKKDAKELKRLVNDSKELGLWNGKFYLPYRWKNHNEYKEVGDWFDSLGNLLAIIFGLADEVRSEKILFYIKKEKLNKPYPVMAIYPPITKKDKSWRDYFLDCDAKDAYHYSNAGVWGYIGCFYVLALIKLKRFVEAEKELKKLAEVNLRENFPEWTNPKTKESFGKLQGWEAGMYVLAYESLKKKKVLI